MKENAELKMVPGSNGNIYIISRKQYAFAADGDQMNIKLNSNTRWL